jgi:hypothetical protein
MQVVIDRLGVAVFTFASLLVAGSVAGWLFSILGFRPPEAIDTEQVRDYLQLPFMMLGAVLAGWSAMMMQIVRGLHALFNVPFAVALAIPLVKLRSA